MQLQKQIIIHHRYPELGSYVVKMNASNEVSMVTHETVAVVLGYICKNPNVTITGICLFNGLILCLFVCLFVCLSFLVRMFVCLFLCLFSIFFICLFV